MIKKMIYPIAILSLVFLFISPVFPASTTEEDLEMVSAGDASRVSAEARDFIDITLRIVKVAKNGTEEVLSRPKVRTVNGMNASILFGSKSGPNQPGVSYSLDLLPLIVNDQNVRLKISLLVKPGMEKPLQQEFLVKSGSTVLAEFLRNETDGSQFVVEITPTIETIVAAREYPQTVSNYDWGETMVLLNDRLLARGKMNARDAEGFLLNSREHGGFYFSFHPFPGAKPLGVCEGNSIKIPLEDGMIVEWFTSKPPLPQGKWLVYAARTLSIPKTTDWKEKNLEMENFGMTKNGDIGVWRWKKADGKSLKPENPPANPLDEKVDFSFKDAEVGTVFKFLVKLLRAELSLDPKLNDKKITCEFVQVSIRQFLDSACKQIGATWLLTREEPPVLKVESL